MKRRALPLHFKNISRDILSDFYITKKYSVSRISKIFKCSQNKINYWLAKYGIAKRSISDAIYELKNPLGDPFLLQQPQTLEEGILFGMGLGLFWGEGEKRGNRGLRLTNSDPKLLRKYIEFLEKVFNIDRKKLRFGLQVFGDVNPLKALNYWKRELGVRKGQFYKIIITLVRGTGTYKNKSTNGVVVVYFNNTRLKRIMCEMIENIQ